MSPNRSAVVPRECYDCGRAPALPKMMGCFECEEPCSNCTHRVGSHDGADLCAACEEGCGPCG